jgi:hypothetical protein
LRGQALADHREGSARAHGIQGGFPSRSASLTAACASSSAPALLCAEWLQTIDSTPISAHS